MSDLKKVYFKTFGCRVNQFDTQVMMSNLKDFQVSQELEKSDIVVINSCTVTNSADVTIRGFINKIKKNHPEKKIIFTGCGAFNKGQDLLDNNKINGVFGHSEKKEINNFLQKDEKFFSLGDLEYVDSTIIPEMVGKSRAFIKIQEGCDFECSYCIIPSVRGNARSHDEQNILEQVNKLASNGFGEIILTGTNVGSYGKDKNSSLAKLIKKLSYIRGVRRIRIGSIEPTQIDDEFKELLNEDFMAKHLHIAIQHSSDTVLEIMKRQNRVKDDIKLFEELSQYGYALGTDYIVGHPGETELEWKNAIENIKNYPLTHIHGFTYSKRDGTVAATLKESVSNKIAKIRLKELTDIIDQKNIEFRKKFHDNFLNVLIETFKDDYYIGLDQYFNKVKIKSNEDIKGDWIVIDDYKVENSFNLASYD
jgi:threonylcarbamoyladenosine tRNA methylthiotransferase MtaB